MTFPSASAALCVYCLTANISMLTCLTKMNMLALLMLALSMFVDKRVKWIWPGNDSDFSLLVLSFSFPHGPALLSLPYPAATILYLPHFLPPPRKASEAERQPQGLQFPSFFISSSSLLLLLTWSPSFPLPRWWHQQAEGEASLQDEAHRRGGGDGGGERRRRKRQWGKEWRGEWAAFLFDVWR